MPIAKERNQALVKEYGKSAADTGDSGVQVALLTERINFLTEHAKGHVRDHHSRQGLLKLVGQRKSLLDYLKKHNIEKYRLLIKKLNIRK
ncbi:MAG TPA: 30S ribosomal protein S15 [Chitinivibrionales bacterium]|nr:30S ribosomal protein S15 [Chitinivibrionales bacterium]